MRASSPGIVRRGRRRGAVVRAFALSLGAALLSTAARPARADVHSTLRPPYRSHSPPRDTLHVVGSVPHGSAWCEGDDESVAALESAWQSALLVAGQLPGFVVAAGSAACHELMERRAPDLFERVRASARDGSWQPVGGWWTEVDMTSAHGESIVRQALYGQRYFERALGRRARIGWLPEAGSGVWTLPQILQGSGLRALVIGATGWADTTRYPYDEFLWQGNDGTRIFVDRPRRLPAAADTVLLRQALAEVHSLHGRDRLVLADVGTPAADGLVEPVREARRPPGGTPVRFSSPGGALFEVRTAIPADSVTVWRDEIILAPDTGIRTSSPPSMRAEIEARLRTAEAAATIAAGLPGGPAYPERRLQMAWRGLLSGQLHDATVHNLDSIAGNRFAAIRAEMDTRGEPTGAYVLFNPLGRTRNGAALIEVAAPGIQGDIAGMRSAGALALVSVSDVPALGAVVAQIGSDGLPGVPPAAFASPAAGDTWMENSFLRVEIDRRSGDIVRILDKVNGRQALRAGGRANTLRAGDGETVALLSLSSSVTPRAARMSVVRQLGASIIRQELVLGRSAPFLDVRTEVAWAEPGLPLDIEFEPAVAPDSVTWEIPYGSIRHAASEARAGRAEAEPLPGRRWADVSEDGYGISVLAVGGSGWAYRMGALRMRVLTEADVRAMGDEPRRRTLRFAIYPHRGDWTEAGTHRLAAEYATPVLAVIEPPHAGRLGRRFSFASSGAPNVEIEWLKRAEDGERFVMRLVEWSGIDGVVDVATACPAARAWSADLLEDTGDPLPADGGGFRIGIRSRQIATAIFSCGDN